MERNENVRAWKKLSVLGSSGLIEGGEGGGGTFARVVDIIISL